MKDSGKTSFLLHKTDFEVRIFDTGTQRNSKPQ